MKTHTEYLKYEFTDAEITGRAKELAASTRQRSSLEQAKKEIDADMKGQIEAQNSIIQRLAAQIEMGYEYRNIDCRVELDSPEPGRKTIVRLDTGEECRVVMMDAADKQASLDLAGQDGEFEVTGTIDLSQLAARKEDAIAVAGAASAFAGKLASKRKRNPEAEGFADESAE